MDNTESKLKKLNKTLHINLGGRSMSRSLKNTTLWQWARSQGCQTGIERPVLEQPSALALPLAWAPFGPCSFPAMPVAHPDYYLQVSTVHLEGAVGQAGQGGRECPLATAALSLSTMRHGVIHSACSVPLNSSIAEFLANNVSKNW